MSHRYFLQISYIGTHFRLVPKFTIYMKLKVTLLIYKHNDELQSFNCKCSLDCAERQIFYNLVNTVTLFFVSNNSEVWQVNISLLKHIDYAELLDSVM